MPTDTERLDFLEAQGRAYAESTRLSHPEWGEYGWYCAWLTGGLLHNPKNETFPHSTARDAIDAAMQEFAKKTPAAEEKTIRISGRGSDSDCPL